MTIHRTLNLSCTPKVEGAGSAVAGVFVVASTKECRTISKLVLWNHVDASEAHIATLGRGLDVLGAKLASEILATLPDPPADEASEQDWRYAEELFEKQEVTEGIVTGFNTGGAIIKIGRLRGFVPMSQLSLIHQRMPDELNDENLLPDQRFQKLIELIGQKVDSSGSSRSSASTIA